MGIIAEAIALRLKFECFRAWPAAVPNCDGLACATRVLIRNFPLPTLFFHFRVVSHFLSVAACDGFIATIWDPFTESSILCATSLCNLVVEMKARNLFVEATSSRSHYIPF